jgi:cobalamin synthase
MRNYLYLGAVEGEIREKLGLPAESVSFTREGNFYWGRRSLMQKMSKWYYILVLLIVLLPFLFLKLQSDVDSGNIIMIIVDSIVAILTLLFFVEYSRSSVKLDISKLPPSNPNM